MARYTGPDCRLCRRERMKLYLKGTRCDSPKCAIERRPFPPGEHGRARIKESEYLMQLREKQKARRIYGVLERQFRGYYQTAASQHGVTGEMLLDRRANQRLRTIVRDSDGAFVALLVEDEMAKLYSAAERGGLPRGIDDRFEGSHVIPYSI